MKGVQTKRRDSTKLLKIMFDDAIVRIMDGHSYEQIMDFVLDNMHTMFGLGFSDAYYIITKSLAKDDYKAKPPQVIIKEKMERRGKMVTTGSRITYLITTNGGYKAPQSIKVEEESFFKTYRHILHLDFLYYLEHQLMNPLNEIIEKAFKKKDIITLFYKERVKYHLIVKQLQSIFAPEVEFVETVKRTIIVED